MTTFRLATINVHSFRKPSDRSNNISELVSILEPLNLDLIGVEEIQNNDKWKKFCVDMGLTYSSYGPWNGNSAGNGIASRYPIQSYSTQQSTLICQGGTRSILQCSLDTFQNLTFGVTHLDHLDEDVRLAQINEFNPHKKNIDILMGDMNALTREDYSDDYYQNIVIGQRQKCKWETPRFDLTQLLGCVKSSCAVLKY
jgi:endonuclease/exonuclease/phosphatase family metal-dependent hydrolase